MASSTARNLSLNQKFSDEATSVWCALIEAVIIPDSTRDQKNTNKIDTFITEGNSNNLHSWEFLNDFRQSKPNSNFVLSSLEELVRKYLYPDQFLKLSTIIWLLSTSFGTMILSGKFKFKKFPKLSIKKEKPF